MANDDKQQVFPYVSYATFKNFIGRLSDTVVPDQIDSSMMPSNMSGAAQSGVISALKSLVLIDESGNTSPELRSLVEAYNGSDWSEALKICVLSAYSTAAANVDLASATRRQVENMFEGASPQMRDKYIRFFLAANKDAGIDYSPHITIRRRQTKKRGESKPRKNSQADHKPSGTEGESHKHTKTPEGMFDLPIPIAPNSLIRVPRSITDAQVEMVQAAVAYLRALAKQNEETEE